MDDYKVVNRPVKLAPDRAVHVPQVGRPLMPGEHMSCSERRRADIIRGAQERVWWTYYDAEIIDQADSTTRKQYFFRRPIGVDGKTKIWTNMTTSGVLPDPQEFIVHYVGCYVYPYPSGTTTLKDLLNIQNNTMIELNVNQKTYYQTLSWDMPAGGGQHAFSPAASATTAPDASWNGLPTQLALKRLRIPVFILKNQAFHWLVEMDSVAYGNLTASASAYFYVIMHGELYRQIT